MPIARLTWDDPNSGSTQEDEIRVYRSTSIFDVSNLPTVLATLPADTLSYDDTTVLDGETYYYAVAMVTGSFLSAAFVSVTISVASINWANASFVEHDENSTLWAGKTCRMHISPEEFLFDGDQIRLIAQAWDNKPCEIQQVWVGKSGTTAHDFDGVPIQVLWNGVTVLSLDSGEEAISDPIALSYDESVDNGLVISWQVETGEASDDIASLTTKSNWSSVWMAGSDASTEAATGYTTTDNDAYLISGIEFEQDTLPTGIWVEENEVAHNNSSNSWSTYTGRVAIDVAEIQNSTTKMRITVRALEGESMIADDFFIGLKSGAAGYDGAPTRITWGGEDSLTVPAGEQATSDEILLPYDAAVDDGLIISFYKGAGATGENYSAKTTMSGWKTYYQSGEHADTMSGAGFTAGSRDVTAITKIEFFGTTNVESQWIGALS